MIHRALRLPALIFSLGLAIGPTMVAQTPTVDTYTIDASHSEIGFRIRHLVARTSGRFTAFSGTIHVDTKDITKSSVEVTIQAASINTDNAKRDEHLRNADFFDVAKYPTITFKSTAVKELEKGKLQITGVLTLHGVSKTITFPMTHAGTHPGMKPGTVVAGFIDGMLTINRNDFGMKAYPGVLGDEVEIRLDIEAGK
ncbi:MAG: YceI family protein [Firmicutes bacterium]|nr:YceI family protein [Bacillota bacterium]